MNDRKIVEEPHNAAGLAQLVKENEEWLMARILGYAKRHDYTKYTSTLMEAWRISIAGLNRSLVAALEMCPTIPPVSSDECFVDDPVASFGIMEAKLHRSRGVTLPMFLGLMKYYRRSYIDLIQAQGFAGGKERVYCGNIDRFFDRIELGFCSEWVTLTESDITGELQEKNRVLTNEKNKYLTIFESLYTPVLLLDGKNRLENMNHSWAKTFSDSEIPGAKYYGREEGTQCPDWVLNFKPEVKEDWETEAVLQSNKGEKYFQVRVKRMLDVSDKFSGTVIIFHDIDKLKKTEQELVKACEDLKHSQSQMLHQEKMASIGLLAAGVAHEINNPIAFVSSNLDTLKCYCSQIGEYLTTVSAIPVRGAGDPRQFLKDKREEAGIDEIMEDIPLLIAESIAGTKRIGQIVSDLKGFSRPDENSAIDTDINQCLERTLHICGSQLKGKVRICKEFGELPLVYCCPQQINQVFVNLIINAGQAIADKGNIHIRTWADKTMVHVTVRDTGLGIAPEILPRIFEPFFTSKEVGHGTGLGLSISYDIIKKHQGEISVRSRLGEGSTFEVSIPVTRKGKEDFGAR